MFNIFELMSGDNMLGEQPLKFYSEELTATKIQLVNRVLIMNAQKNSITDLDRKYKERKNKTIHNHHLKNKESFSIAGEGSSFFDQALFNYKLIDSANLVSAFKPQHKDLYKWDNYGY